MALLPGTPAGLLGSRGDEVGEEFWGASASWIGGTPPSLEDLGASPLPKKYPKELWPHHSWHHDP